MNSDWMKSVECFMEKYSKASKKKKKKMFVHGIDLSNTSLCFSLLLMNQDPRVA